MKRKLTATLFVVLCVLAVRLTAKEGAIQCANLIYGENHTSRCFSDEFLTGVQKETAIATERRFKSVKLGSEELFQFPFVVITGEKDFRLTNLERRNLRKYLEKGGFLLASAGCSNEEWSRCFRREMREVFGTNTLRKIKIEEPIYHTVYDINELSLSHGGEPPLLEGLEIDGKIVAVYSPHGLNDTAHTEGCCCCGGNEISNSMQMNVNILVYALLH